jgi:predicted dehydrogenase
MIRVALIGYGYAGRVFHGPLIAATPGLSLHVIGSSQDTAASAYPDAIVLADPMEAVRHRDADLVVIATPNDSHVPLAEAALGAGKHVVVDKPFTISTEEARRLSGAAATTGRILSVFHNRRWDSDFLAVSRELAAGTIGDVLEFRSEIGRYRPVVRDRWRERPGPGSGLWYDLGPHLIDQAVVLFGAPRSVQAALQIRRTGGTAVDWFQAVLGYESKWAMLGASMLAPEAPPRFVVRGTKASLTKHRGDPQEDQLTRGMRPGSPGWGEDSDPLIVLTSETGTTREVPAPSGNYLSYYAALRDAILGQGPNPVTPAQATLVMEIIEAGIRSSKEERVVSFQGSVAGDLDEARRLLR